MNQGKCDFCGRYAFVSANKEGLLKCRTCRANDRYRNAAKHDTCQFCYTVRHVSYRFEDKPVCMICYRARFMKLGTCQDCGNQTIVSMYKKFGKRVCSTCRSRLRMQDTETFEICSLCQKSKPVCTRDLKGQAICYNCGQVFKRRKL